MAAYLPYAGIGSRETPDEFWAHFSFIAKVLGGEGFTLRSGGADGADSMFEAGLEPEHSREIYIPWAGFNKRTAGISQWPTAQLAQDAEILASQVHPNWRACSQGARKLHARNCAQILGAHLNSPSLFVVCWTKGGGLTGGTAQALRLAEYHNVPIFNFGGSTPIGEMFDRLAEHIQKVNKK